MVAQYNKFYLEMTYKQALAAYHPPAGVAELCKQASIARQLKKLDPELLRAELLSHGIWKDGVLDNHQENLQRIVWNAVYQIVESGPRNR